MARILFLAHRIPYPPDKGDKIRSWHLLRHLAGRHEVALGCFVDDPADLQHKDFLAETVSDLKLVALSHSVSRLKAGLALATGRSFSLGYYAHAGMSRWVADKLQRGVMDAVFLYSGAMARFIPSGAWDQVPIYMDFVDMDSDKWRQYGQKAAFPMSWVYSLESARLEHEEIQIANRAQKSFFVSQNEVHLFLERSGISPDKVMALPNGVDTIYFNPDQTFPTVIEGGAPAVVFTGAMDYRANVDGVLWFVQNAWRRVKSVRPDALFYVVGWKPVPDIQALNDKDGIIVTGGVPDVRPYLARANAVVAPLQIARGVQNKVLEAMAMARPVVASRPALQGLDVLQEGEVISAATPLEFSNSLIQLLNSREPWPQARQRVEQSFSWETSLAQLDQILALCKTT